MEIPEIKLWRMLLRDRDKLGLRDLKIIDSLIRQAEMYEEILDLVQLIKRTRQEGIDGGTMP